MWSLQLTNHKKGRFQLFHIAEYVLVMKRTQFKRPNENRKPGLNRMGVF
jgi:hypothetical protein